MNSLRRFLPAAAALALAPFASAGDVYLHPPVIKTPLADAVKAATDEPTILQKSESFAVRLTTEPRLTGAISDLSLLRRVSTESPPFPPLASDVSLGIGVVLTRGQGEDRVIIERGDFPKSPVRITLDNASKLTPDLLPPVEEMPFAAADTPVLALAGRSLNIGVESLLPVNAAASAEAAAGFPGEVIDEVIVPVPSEIFLVLDKLGKPDWKSELRSVKPPVFSQRIDVALLLGNTVAEGFVAVQAQDRDAVERIGKDVLKLSESLGLKEKVLPHTNSILEASKGDRWETVRLELDKTQKTVRDTMEQRRDSELAQCVSLGGWLRGTEAVTDLITRSYTSDSAELLNQPDIIRHFQKQLKKMSGRNAKLKDMLEGLNTINGVIGNGDEPPNSEGVKTIHQTTARLVKSITTPAQ